MTNRLYRACASVVLDFGRRMGMTLKEMGGQYRVQAQVLQQRIRELKASRLQTDSRQERDRLTNRILSLETIWRETKDLAVLLERYYERGYRRNERYTL